MEENNATVDNYGCLTFPTPSLNCSKSNTRLPKQISLSVVPSFEYIPSKKNFEHNDNSEFKMRELYFLCNCKKNKDQTRTLILHGRNLEDTIGRRLQNWDIPYLTLFLHKHDNVTKLVLAYNSIDSAGFINLIDYITTNDNIIQLDLRSNCIGDPGINYMFHKKDKLKVKILNLSGNKIGFKNAKKVAIVIAKNTFIEELYVAETDQMISSLMYYTTVMRLDQNPHNETLKVLDLSRPIPQCKFSKVDTVHIAGALGSMLRNNTCLEKLYLQKFNFYCHDIEEMLLNSKYNNTLKLLDLSCNNIGDHGAEILSKWLQDRPTVQSLLLGHNIISNHGIRSLSRSIPFSKLLVLDLSYNRFDDQAGSELFLFLKKTPLLEHIQVFGNSIGHETAKIIKRMLLSGVLVQEHIDVKVYEIDGTLQLSYYQPKPYNKTYYKKRTVQSDARRWSKLYR